jgi:hypothetical protein
VLEGKETLENSSDLCRLNHKGTEDTTVEDRILTDVYKKILASFFAKEIN